ncbi:hypothetical protein [Mucilaginibacter lacusdianchii]|uniref:hypothetical protein n=1 Tax=Mucilaginibacter lacusdianchii TaxID=2684211 RepID=UPI00131D8EE7|nr:hypothetical protein [Mucilaginibacter sp. JXJ CY 39]
MQGILQLVPPEVDSIAGTLKTRSRGIELYSSAGNRGFNELFAGGKQQTDNTSDKDRFHFKHCLR